MIKKNLLWDKEPSDGGGGVDASGAPQSGTEASAAGADVLEGVEQAPEKPEGEEAPIVEAEESEEADTKKTADIVAAVLQQVIPQGQPAAAPSAPAARQPTQEEYERAFNVFKADEVLLQRLRSEDPKVALEAVHMLRDGLIKQAMTMAEARLHQQIEKLRTEDLGPINDFVSEARANELRSTFMGKYEDLRPYEAIVDAVCIKMEQNGSQFANRDAMFKEIAKNARATVKTLLAAKGGNGAGTSPGTRPKMTTVSAGGQGGGGGGRGGKSGVPVNVPPAVADGLAVFD